MSEILTVEQIAFYDENGYLVLENCIPDAIISDIRAKSAWFEDEAKGMTAGNHRLNLEDSHTPDNPRVRRIKLTHTASDVACDLMTSDRALAPVGDLCLHASKLNLKPADYGAAVECHQDFALYPHKTDDALAVAIITDEMVLEKDL